MNIHLWEKPKKNAVIIEGFPGFGFVSTIVAEFLVDHLKAKQIGAVHSEKIPAMTAIHKSEVVDPFAIFYDEKTNIVIVRAITPIKNMEWEVSDTIRELAKMINTKEIISTEGINALEKTTEPKAFFYTADAKKKKKLEALGLKQLNEGIIVGATASLLLELRDNVFIFVESAADVPDSRGAAKIIEILNKYLKLDIDYKPLLEKAEKFESKIKDILIKGLATTKEKKEREAVYVG